MTLVWAYQRSVKNVVSESLNIRSQINVLQRVCTLDPARLCRKRVWPASTVCALSRFASCLELEDVVVGAAEEPNGVFLPSGLSTGSTSGEKRRGGGVFGFAPSLQGEKLKESTIIYFKNYVFQIQSPIFVISVCLRKALILYSKRYVISVGVIVQ